MINKCFFCKYNILNNPACKHCTEYSKFKPLERMSPRMRSEYLMLKKLEKEGCSMNPLTAHQAMTVLIEYLLGPDWHVVDSLGPTQVYAIAVHEIMKKYPKI